MEKKAQQESLHYLKHQNTVAGKKVRLHKHQGSLTDTISMVDTKDCWYKTHKFFNKSVYNHSIKKSTSFVFERLHGCGEDDST